jgi:PilZ domain
MSTELISGDRRADRRYQFDLQLQFQYTDERGVLHGSCGVTAELSRGGIRFFTEEPPPIGAYVEARVAWPFKLQNICPLELRVEGPVIRSQSGEVVLRMKDYEFRTCGERSFFERPQETAAWRVA